MASVLTSITGQPTDFVPGVQLPPLENGDRLDQPTFHARYLAMPEDVRAELIGGIVYMSSPLRRSHARRSPLLARWLDEYAEANSGLEVLENATVILGPQCEPQPDLCLVNDREHGGQTRDQDDYVFGPPELVVEVAGSTESIDLHTKKADYERFGVQEYLVIALRQARVYWFALESDAATGTRRFVEMAPDVDGTLRSRLFPGLWLDVAGALANDRARVLDTLRRGLASALGQQGPTQELGGTP